MKNFIIDGSHLTTKQIYETAHGISVPVIPEKAMNRVNESHQLLLGISSSNNHKVYGMNTSVGLNKDRSVAPSDVMQFNLSLLRSHNVAIRESCTKEEVRAVLLVLINGFLRGNTGVSPALVKYLVTFLEKDVCPIMKWCGSIGEADIGPLSSIGLVLTGEGEAEYRGRIMAGSEVLASLGLSPLILGPKEGLGLISSNAQSHAFTALFLERVFNYLDMNQLIYCLSLEGINGVVDPLNQEVNLLKGSPNQIRCAEQCRSFLEGSYLWQPDKSRSLQDPLSFRNQIAVAAAVLDALQFAQNQLALDLNHTQDNPCLLPQEKRFIGNCNFETLSLVQGIEMSSIALAHLSKMICHRILRISDPRFSGLDRFLTPNANVLGFPTVQKTVSILDTEIRMYANPSSLDFLEVAGAIEDHAANTAFAVKKISSILDNLYYLSAIELIHGAQAVTLRGNPRLGEKTRKLYTSFREVIPALYEDRDQSADIEKSRQFVQDAIDKLTQ